MNLDWMERAACAGMDPGIFFPEQACPHKVAQAQAICRGCPVRFECTAHAEASKSPGIWGGVARDDDGRLLRCTVVGKPLSKCGTEAGFYRHQRHGETPCMPCKLAQAAAQNARRAARKARTA